MAHKCECCGGDEKLRVVPPIMGGPPLSTRQDKNTRCIYLNNFRIAGGKPWGGGSTTKEWTNVTLRQVIRAFPDLQAALGFDYLGNPLPPSQPTGK